MLGCPVPAHEGCSFILPSRALCWRGSRPRDSAGSPAWRLASASGEGAPSAASQLLRGGDTDKETTMRLGDAPRPAGVLVLEDDEGGVARAPRSPPRGERLVQRPIAPPAVPRSERMHRPRPGARPPRFLFSFSTPRAAGAALHRRGFPGTLPPPTPTPLSAPPQLPTTRSPVATARPGPQRPSPQPRCWPPRRLAAASPTRPCAARRRSL